MLRCLLWRFLATLSIRLHFLQHLRTLNSRDRTESFFHHIWHELSLLILFSSTRRRITSFDMKPSKYHKSVGPAVPINKSHSNIDYGEGQILQQRMVKFRQQYKATKGRISQRQKVITITNNLNECQVGDSLPPVASTRSWCVCDMILQAKLMISTYIGKKPTRLERSHAEIIRLCRQTSAFKDRVADWGLIKVNESTGEVEIKDFRNFKCYRE